jgi:ABC-type multidrug transport system ATPase subunit
MSVPTRGSKSGVLDCISKKWCKMINKSDFKSEVKNWDLIINTLHGVGDGEYNEQHKVCLKSGAVFAVVGPNGVGKSALLEEMFGQLRHHADTEKFSGHRQIYFQSDDVDAIGLSWSALQQNLSNESVNRLRNPFGEQHLRSVIRRIIDRQNQDNHDMMQDIRSGTSLEDAEARHSIMLDELNGVFSAARMAVDFVIDGGTLRARRSGIVYGIEKMSDGERAALLVAGAVLVRPPSSCIIIDEPERHLNPAISGPLITALIRARPDVGFIFATHDFNLLEWIKPETIIHLSDSKIYNQSPERRYFRIEIIERKPNIDETLKYALLGSRNSLLLVEGSDTSDDLALYGQIYTDWNVVARGGWDSVTADVRAIRRSDGYHWLNVAGIIDGDGRDQNERDELESDSIYALPLPSIENAFFLQPIVSLMARHAHSYWGGSSAERRVTDVEAAILPAVQNARDDLLARQLVWLSTRELAARKISVKSARDGQSIINSIDSKEIRARLEQRIDEALKESSPFELLRSVPIKNTAIPVTLCKKIGFGSFSEFKQSLLHQMQANTPIGGEIREILLWELPRIRK